MSGKAPGTSRTVFIGNIWNMDGCTFTIFNLGTFDVERFTAIINPSQTGILRKFNCLVETDRRLANRK